MLQVVLNLTKSIFYYCTVKNVQIKFDNFEDIFINLSQSKSSRKFAAATELFKSYVVLYSMYSTDSKKIWFDKNKHLQGWKSSYDCPFKNL